MMRTMFMNVAALSLMLVVASQCQAIQFIKLVTKAEAEKLGVTLNVTPNGEAGYKVWIEYEPKGELKNFLYFEVESRMNGKLLAYAQLHTFPQEKGRVAAHFSTEPSNLVGTTISVVVYDQTHTRVGYRIRVADYIDAAQFKEAPK